MRGWRPGQHTHKYRVVGLAILAGYFSIGRAAGPKVNVVGLRQFLAGTITVAFEEGYHIPVVGDTFVQIPGVQQVAELDSPVSVEKLSPYRGTDTFWNQVRVAPLALADFALEQHVFDAQMFCAIFDFHVHPGVALEQIDLLIHLLVEPGEDLLTRRRQNLYHALFALDLFREMLFQANIQPQAAGDL